MNRARLATTGVAFIALAMAIAVLATTLGVSERERQILRTFHRWLDDWAGPVFEGASVIGYVQVLVPVAALVALVFAGAWRRPAVAVAPLAATSIAGACNPLIKLVFDRQRPNLNSNHALTSLSMPSGHAATSAAFAISIAIVLWRTRARWIAAPFLCAFAIFVGVSRMVLGVHWPTDVLAGWLLGAGIALLVAALFEQRGPSQQTPTASGRATR